MLNANYAAQILRMGGWPVTKQNVAFIQAWHQQEGGGDHNTANFNPLNTTHGQGPSINSVGVKSFAGPKQGAKFTVETILNGRYPHIAQGLAAGNPYASDITGDLSTWVSGRPDSQSGARYASRVLGRRTVPPGGTQPQIKRVDTRPLPGAVPRKSRNQVLAAGLLGFASAYAQSGRIDSNAIAQLTGAVDEAGTLVPPTPRQASAKQRSPLAGGLVDNVLAAAHGQVGKPYVFGSGPDTSSFDCSDLIQWAYGQVGIKIPRTTFDQINVGKAVDPKHLQPGDLVFPSNHHVVMYVGGGRVIAAPHTGTVVQYQPLSQFGNIVAARRIVN